MLSTGPNFAASDTLPDVATFETDTMENESVKKHVLDLRSELEKTREQRDTHLRRAEQITTTELQQVRKERLLNHGKVCIKHHQHAFMLFT